MLNVCGVTYTNTCNYGTCLQAYALQNTIESMIINGEKCTYELINTKLNRSLLGSIVSRHYRRAFKAFEKEFMHLINDAQTLDELNKKKDLFVCGSDVIWNPIYNRGNSVFFLEFAKKYCFSYAASFGQTEPDEQYLNTLKHKLDRFSSISVREHEGAEIVKRYAGKEAVVTLDPTFLLGSNEWNRIAEQNKQMGKYILVYTIGMRPIVEEFVEKLRDQTKLKVIYAVGNTKAAFQQRFLQMQSPQRWLSLVRDAEYVVTNSFHGTAFSLIYHKKFFTPVNGELNSGFNVRMYQILKQIGLVNRMCRDIPDRIDLSDIDYSTVDAQLNALRNQSLYFIRKNLENAYLQKQGIGG